MVASESMRRSRVTLTAPSVLFSTGTTPNAARPRSTSSKTSMSVRAGRKSTVAPKRPSAAWWVNVAWGPRYATVNGPSSARHAVLRGQLPQDLSFPLRDIRRRPLPSFEVADLKGGLGALVEEVEDLVVEFVDPGPPVGQVHRNTCPRCDRRLAGL